MFALFAKMLKVQRGNSGKRGNYKKNQQKKNKDIEQKLKDLAQMLQKNTVCPLRFAIPWVSYV